MASIMKGADIPVFITDMPEGLIIKRLDFSQKDHIVITKETDDFTVSGNEAQTVAHHPICPRDNLLLKTVTTAIWDTIFQMSIIG